MPERIIRPGILTSDRVCALSWPAEVFYRRLMSVADDFGRYDGRPAILRASLYPLQLEKVSDSDVGKWRLETAKAGLVRVYSIESKEYVEILNFSQRMRASKSKYPAPDGHSPSSACNRMQPHASATESEAETESEASSGLRPGTPTVEAVINYGQTIGAPPPCCESFWQKHESTAWMLSGSPITNWRPLLVRWKTSWLANDHQKSQQGGSKPRQQSFTQL